MDNKSLKKYTKNYFSNISEKKVEIFDVYKEFLANEGIALTGKNICDIGCAKGLFLRDLMNENNCFGYDISEYAINYCKKKFKKRARFALLDLNNETLDMNKKFDIITLFDVIEHLNNFDNLKNIINNNLKNNGIFIVTTPTANSFLRPMSNYIKFSGEADATHAMLFTPYTLDFFLRRLGLDKKIILTPYSFYFKNNLFTKKVLLGGQILAIYKKIL